MNTFDLLNQFAIVLFGAVMFLFGKIGKWWTPVVAILIIIFTLYLFNTYDWS